MRCDRKRDPQVEIPPIRELSGARPRPEHMKLVAALADIIKSKRATGRDRDKAVLDILQKTLDEQEYDKD